MSTLAVFLGLAWIWGGSFIAIKYTVDEFDPTLAAALRVCLGGAFLAIGMVIARKSFAIPRNRIPHIALVGVFLQALPFALLFWGEKVVTAGLASILNSTTPIWTFLLTIVVMKSGFSIQKLVGITIGFVGVVTIFAPRVGAGLESEEFLRALAVVGTAASYAIGLVLSQKFLDKRYLMANLFWQHVFGGILLTLVSVATGSSILEQGLQAGQASWAGVVYLALFANAIGWPMFFYVSSRWDTVRASTVTYIVPLCALILDYLLLENLLPGREAAGAILILSGVVLVQLRFRRVPVPSPN